jgi:hypothetical protein
MARHQTVLGDQSRESLVHPKLVVPEDLLKEQTAGLQRELTADPQEEATVSQQGELMVDLQREPGMVWQTTVTVVLQTARHQGLLTGK